MKVLYAILTILIFSGVTIADEVTLGIDRVVLLMPNQVEHNNRFAVHFSLPQEIYGLDINSAELYFLHDFSGFQVSGDSVLEFQTYEITTDWGEDATWSSPWEQPGGDIDTLSFFTYTIIISSASEVFMDITEYIKSVVKNGQENYGLMLIPFKYDEVVFNLPPDLISSIMASAQIKIVY